MLTCVHVCLCAVGGVPLKIKGNRRRTYLKDLNSGKMWSKLIKASKAAEQREGRRQRPGLVSSMAALSPSNPVLMQVMEVSADCPVLLGKSL